MQSSGWHLNTMEGRIGLNGVWQLVNVINCGIEQGKKGKLSF